MLPKKLRRNPGRFRAVVYAVLVHAVVVGLAVIGFRWTVESPPGEVVEAVVVPEPPARKPEEADKRARELEEARRQAEAEQRRQAELKKKQEEELAQQRLLAERRKKEAEEKERQKRAQEAERRKEEQRRQMQAEQTLQEQLAQEERLRAGAARSARVATELDRYKAIIRQHVSRNWNRPPGIGSGLKCEVDVRLTPGGEVLSARVVRSSGNAVFDRSVENAVYKAAPLPLPADPSLFDHFREIRFVFDAEKES